MPLPVVPLPRSQQQLLLGGMFLMRGLAMFLRMLWGLMLELMRRCPW
jgi:hypothetical protein